jgi:hypothetical protein
MAVNDEVMFGIYNELQTLRCLKQIELGMAVGKSNCRSVAELEALTDMIANPKKYFAEEKNNKRKENKDDKD